MSRPSYLKDINHLYAEGNLGGVVDIKVARRSDFLVIADPIDGTIKNEVEFKTGKNWRTWMVQLESAIAIGNSQVSRQGVNKNNSINFTIAKDRNDLKWMLDLAQMDELIVLFKDGNGQSKIAGQTNRPMRFQYEYNSGSQFDSLNGYNCSFYYDGPNNIFFYSTELTGAILMESSGYILAEDGSKILLE